MIKDVLNTFFYLPVPFIIVLIPLINLCSTQPAIPANHHPGVGQFPTKGDVVMEDFIWVSSQELQLGFLLKGCCSSTGTNHAAFQQQCPKGHESRVGGTPLFSQTPLYRSWRIPEVGLRAHPLNLSVLMGVWRVGTAQLSCSEVKVSVSSWSM